MTKKTKAFLEWARQAGVKAISMTGGDVQHVEFFEVTQDERLAEHVAEVERMAAELEQAQDKDPDNKVKTEFDKRREQAIYWSS